MNNAVRKMTLIAGVAGLIGAAGTSAMPFSHGALPMPIQFDPVAGLASLVDDSAVVDDYSGAPAVQPPCSDASPGDNHCALPLGAFEIDKRIGAPALPVAHAFGSSAFYLAPTAAGRGESAAKYCGGGQCIASVLTAKDIAGGAGYSSYAVAMLWTVNGNQPPPSSLGHRGTGSPILNIVPEPGSMALVGIALAGLMVMRRRRAFGNT